MSEENKLQLTDLLALAQRSRATTQPCTCAIDAYRGWTAMPAGFPATRMLTLGALGDGPCQERTFAEYHPDATNYWSPLAPIALRHYPYNDCSVLQCSVCGRVCLNYVEASGHYPERRIRALDPVLIVDAPVEN